MENFSKKFAEPSFEGSIFPATQGPHAAAAAAAACRVGRAPPRPRAFRRRRGAAFGRQRALSGRGRHRAGMRQVFTYPIFRRHVTPGKST